MQTETAIIPVAIKNTDYLMGKKKGIANAGTIGLHLLKPIETKGLSIETDLEDVMLRTRNAVAEELAKT
jgi:hypothetical protein